MNQPPTCSLCLEVVCIPVEIICFPCYSNTAPSCFSLQRVCLECCRQYLQLHKSPADRDTRVKCIFCPAVVDLQHLTQPPYRTDYALIRTIDQTISIRKCPYCSETFSSMLSLDRHIENECPSHYIPCECQEMIRRRYLEQHYRECPMYQKCTFCHHLVLRSELQSHTWEKHRHLPCYICHEYFSYISINEHVLHECPERMVGCDICGFLIRKRNKLTHLQKHERENGLIVEEKQAELQRLKQTQRQIRHLISKESQALDRLDLIDLR